MKKFYANKVPNGLLKMEKSPQDILKLDIHFTAYQIEKFNFLFCRKLF